MWVKNLTHLDTSAEVHLEQLRPSPWCCRPEVFWWDYSFTPLHGLFCEECWPPWLTQCGAGLTTGFKGLNSSAICSSSSNRSPHISAFCYRVWGCYCLSHVLISVADTMAPSPWLNYAHIHCCALQSFSGTSDLFRDLSFSFLLPRTPLTCLCLSTGLCPVQQRTV